MDDDKGDYRIMAKAAITAAAEVGDQHTYDRPLSETVVRVIERKDREIKEAVSATIERCAQEVRKILEDEYGSGRLDEIVERIRALKDKP